MKNARTVLAAAAALLTVGLALFSLPAFSYLPSFEAPGVIVRWSLNSFPIQWDLNPDITGAKISGGRSVADMMQAAFGTWQSAPNVNLPVSRGPNSSHSSKPSVATIKILASAISDNGNLLPSPLAYARR
jgi:hypothetical protein